MVNEVTNGSVNFERVTQDELQKVQRLHDEHSKEIEHDNKTIDPEDTQLNYHKSLLNLDKLLQEQIGVELDKKNEKLTEDFNNGKISLLRFQERKMTIDKWLNHSGKNPKKAFTLGVVYVGDEKQTQQKLDKLGFDYTVEKLKGKDGNWHKHFHLTDPKQREQWKKIWADTFRNLANSVNRKNAGIKIFDMTVHLDEASPHCHYKILNCGRSATGKFSYNLTQSLSDFNKSLGYDRQYNKVTKKSPKKRLSGKLTMKTSSAAFSKGAVNAFNWSLKHNGFNQQWKFQHKGKSAKLTNQMSADEFKKYKANLEVTQDAYKAITGQKAFHKDNTPLSPLEMSRGFSKASKDIEKQKKDNEAKNAELAENEQKLHEQIENDKFNSFVRQQFIERLNQRRLIRLRQREKEHDKEVNETKNQLIDTLVENDPEHVVDKKLLKPNETPQQVKTLVGRQQHQRQTIKYLADVVKKSFEKVKERAEQVVNKFVKSLYDNDGLSTDPNSVEYAKQHSSYILVGTIEQSKSKFDHKREVALMNDPMVKLKKALAIVSDDAIKKSQQQLFTSYKDKQDENVWGE